MPVPEIMVWLRKMQADNEVDGGMVDLVEQHQEKCHAVALRLISPQTRCGPLGQYEAEQSNSKRVDFCISPFRKAVARQGSIPLSTQRTHNRTQPRSHGADLFHCGIHLGHHLKRVQEETGNH
jgi:hypothetical protein